VALRLALIGCGTIANRRHLPVYAAITAKAIALTIYESATAGQPIRVEDVLAGRVRDHQRPIDDHWAL